MSINQIYTTNTFAQWLTVTQALVEKYNYYEDRTNLVFDTANSTINVYNNTVSVYGNTTNVYDNTVNVYIDTTKVYSNTVNVYNNTISVYSNTTNVYSNTVNVYNNIQSYVASAYDTANAVYVTSNLALETANAALEASNTFFANVFNIQNETGNANTFFVTFVDQTVGVPKDVYVSSSKLSYIPSTGNLSSTISHSQNVITTNITTSTVTASGLVSATDFNSTSDITLKENISQIENSIEIIEKLTGIRFNWKNTKETSYGLSAQEVEKILPEIVKTRENGYKGINYLNIIAILIESVKEIKKELEQIKNQINKK